MNSRLDYRFMGGCRFCSAARPWHYRTLDHGDYTPPSDDHLLIRMRFRAIRRELRKLMNQLPKGTARGRL